LLLLLLVMAHTHFPSKNHFTGHLLLQFITIGHLGLGYDTLITPPSYDEVVRQKDSWSWLLVMMTSSWKD